MISMVLHEKLIKSQSNRAGGGGGRRAEGDRAEGGGRVEGIAIDDDS